MPTISFDRFELGMDRRKGRGVSDANRLFDLTNGYVTTGWAIRKRPGLEKVAQLEPGSVGLMAYDGKLNTFSAVSDPSHPVTDDGVTVDNHQVPYSADSNDDVHESHFEEVFNGAIYIAIEYQSGNVEHHYITGSSPWHITDVNCPHTKAGLRIAEKIFAVDDDVVDYSATSDPTDWTTSSDAGFLPTGLRTPGDPTATGLGDFQGQLAAFMSDTCQIWAVDPDPAQNALDKVIRNVGSRYPLSIDSVSEDLFFLAPNGYRSVAIQKFTNNLIDLDVGTPIDDIVVPQLTANINPRSLFFSGGGQYLCAIKDKLMHVYTFSRSAEISAWSKYEFPVDIEYMTTLSDTLYVRSGDTVYRVNQDQRTDDGQEYQVFVDFSFLSFKKPGVLKQIHGVEVVAEGEGEIAFRYDANDPDKITEYVPFSGDTRSGPMIPVEVMATELAPVIRYTGSADFRLDSLSFHYNNLGLK